jgi:ABC-2 type transport system ATP-binding protein
MIVADGISKFYGARQALADISFRIETGEVVGFLGKNGAGKTTMLKILSGLLLPSSGTLKVDDVDGLAQPRELRRRIGFLPDRPPLYGDMSVRQMLRYAGRLNGVAAGDIEGREGAVLQLADLVDVADDLVEWLSHGYRQRVGIAQSIVHDPALVILDEPISGLDPEQIVGMRKLIRSLAEKHTVLLSSHILGEISQTCDRLLVLNKGRIVAEGTEGELVHGAASETLELLLRAERKVAERALDDVEGVSAVEVISEEDELLRLRLQASSGQAREALVKALVEQGVGVRRIAEAEGGALESVFLSLTGGDGPKAKDVDSSAGEAAEEAEA